MTIPGPIIGRTDRFELEYTERFRAICHPHGEFVKYERDRAGIDCGLHLTEPSGGGRRLTTSRIWFQLKGIQASTLSAADIKDQRTVAVEVPLAHLKYWYASAEPVFLAVYLESLDEFIAEPISSIVARKWGASLLSPDTFEPSQRRVSIHVDTSARLTAETFKNLPKFVAMGLDGPTFRGRYLGHRLDPLRSFMSILPPTTFRGICSRLLELHDYRPRNGSIQRAAIDADDAGNDTDAWVGRFYSTFEWVLHLTTEFGVDEDDFRSDGPLQSIQGDCMVCVCADPVGLPGPNAIRGFVGHAKRAGLRRMLVFLNSEDYSQFGAWFSAGRQEEIQCDVLLRPEVSYCLLTCSAAYLDFRTDVSWKLSNYL